MFKLSSIFRWLTGQAFTLYISDSPSQPSAPSTTTQITDIPDWLKPRAKDALSKAEALTDINQNPYQKYGGQRVADFSGLQKTAMGNVANPEAWGKNVEGFMSPYMENVVKRQQQNALDQYGAQAGAVNAKAAQMGAFGGSGIALQRAAGNRDLQRQLGDISATGYQNAFQQANQQANTNLAQQTQLGALQQQNAQQRLDVDYNNFLEQKNYPYQQLSYYLNAIRGVPMGMNSTSQVYQAAPSSTAQNIGAFTTAYGASKLLADGGHVNERSGGGLADLAISKIG